MVVLIVAKAVRVDVYACSPLFDVRKKFLAATIGLPYKIGRRTCIYARGCIVSGKLIRLRSRLLTTCINGVAITSTTNGGEFTN